MFGRLRNFLFFCIVFFTIRKVQRKIKNKKLCDLTVYVKILIEEGLQKNGGRCLLAANLKTERFYC